MIQRMRFLRMLFPLFLSLTITGCGLQELLVNKNNSSKNQKSVISVSLNEDDPNNILYLKGIEDMAKKDDIQIMDLSQATGEKNSSNAETDVGKESIYNANGATLQGGKVLIYQGGDPNLLQNAQEKTIPVLALSRLPSRIQPAGIVLSDQEKIGEQMAITLTNKLTEGQVVILEDDPNSSNSQEMLLGSRSVLSKFPKLTIETIGTPTSESVAKETLPEYLQKNPGKVQAVLAQTEKLAAQAAEVLKGAQLEKKVVLIGGEANIQSLKRMSSGVQLGDVDISPYLQGIDAYQWAKKLLKNEGLDADDSITSDQGEIPAKLVSVKAVTPENLSLELNNYTQEISSIEQEKQTLSESQGKQSSSESKQNGGGSQDKQTANQVDTNNGDGGNPQSSVESSQVLPGVSKVTEQIKTETTREYLDSQGKVIGTEKSSNEKDETVPPEVIKQEDENHQNSEQDNTDPQSDQPSQ
ncbi:ABC-type sugar transport system, periplasmic component [Candidatus Desulfosporosinus infrequens]|uniref:ABC-type sugar transport system, periplasmic component n=1 Tax=Candidatus Desulfosporosinus infrequens TaxID=2043169 RepID=A0A2U3KH43_9FIRM|nr:ABC-type sugar transport system, periplasmic component [Candidatus Desulfosporosinus infrequens]